MSHLPPSTPHSAPTEIVTLVERFHTQRADYRSGRYNETQLRRDFLDPLFEALGWDVANRKNYSEKFREVLHEVSVEIEGHAKAADYAFKSGQGILFLVEAKKPAVNIETNPEPAFQIRRYGWSAKVPVGILSDFEQLAVYDCREKPVHGDPAYKGRVKLYSYQDYIKKWDEIRDLFSHQAVHQGSLDRFVAETRGKRGTADVDDAFLLEMERWREELARNIALRNRDLTQRELNSAVQMTIDRIIFLRICEDRGIEPENALRDATDGKDVYGDLMVLFQQADKKYNSGLFHFNPEKGQSSYPDTLTPALKIDDRVLKDILANLYLPKSPYAFNYISADILGQVYERFLGKVIRLTGGHQAKVEEKPEVRKAGGVYYTPTYIVEYIVSHTVGELLKDKDPETLKTQPLRVLDPACGSGSFLLGAYQYLLDWYLDWYVQHEPARWARGKNPALFETPNGWQLTMEKKKDILTRHIYGVDIDTQAVEVTKLSLLLKVVENPGQLSLFSERILPDLGENVKCGNSLIGPEYYESQQMALFDSEEQYRVNAFDWQAAFPRAFKDGGFDAVIGNPPYIRIQAMKEWAPKEVEFYKKRYQAASKGNYDIYVVFVEKGLSLLNAKGRLGFILPHKFFNAQYGEPLRGLIASGKNLSKVVHFGDEQVFEGATTYTCLMFLDKQGGDFIEYEKVDDLENWREGIGDCNSSLLPNSLTSSEWVFFGGKEIELFTNLNSFPIKLRDITEKIFQGLVTSSDMVYFLDPLADEDNGLIRVFSKATNKEYVLETEVVKPLIKGSRDISPYRNHPSKRVIFPYDPVESSRTGKSVLIPPDKFQKNYPRTWAYLKENYETLRDREKGKMRHDGWYGYVYPKSVSLFSKTKILTPSIASRASFTFDKDGEFYFVGSGGGGGGGYGILIKDSSTLKYEFLLGLLNSKLLDHFLKKISSPFQGGYFAFSKQYIEQLPIRTIDFSNPAEAASHERMVKLVETMLALHQQAAAARLPDEKERLQRQIQSTDRQIDRLVYDLYGLTEEEIRIVEGTNS